MMMSRLKSMILGNWGGRVVLTTIIISGSVLILRQLGIFQGLELRSYDGLISSRADKKPDDRILVVKITENDLKSLQEPFIYDETLAQAMNKLQQYEPAVIAVDIDRSIPMPKGEKREALARELQKDNVVGICALSGLEFEGSPPPPEISPNQVGFADLPDDPDGVMRRSLLITTPPVPLEPFEVDHLCNNPNPEEGELFSFTFLSVIMYLERMAEPESQIAPTEDFKIAVGETILERLSGNAGGYQIKEEDMGTYSILIDYRNRSNVSETVTLSELLDNRVSPQLVKDRIVFIGYDTIAIPDSFLTPYSQGSQEENAKMPGVVVHAQIASQLLAIALDGEKPISYLPQPVEWIWIIFWAVMGGLITVRKCKQLWLVGLIELGLIGILYLAVRIAMGGASLWLPFPSTVIGLILTTLGAILIDRVPSVQKMLKINIEIDWDQVRKEADKLLSISGGSMIESNQNGLDQADLEAAEKKAKQSYLEEIQQRAKERRKKKPANVGGVNMAIAPVTEIETEQSLFSRLQEKMSNLKQRLSSRKPQGKTAIAISHEEINTYSGQTLEQKAEMEKLERYIEEVLQKARQVKQKI
jgi:adenylate cyclase